MTSSEALGLRQLGSHCSQSTPSRRIKPNSGKCSPGLLEAGAEELGRGFLGLNFSVGVPGGPQARPILSPTGSPSVSWAQGVELRLIFLCCVTPISLVLLPAQNVFRVRILRKNSDPLTFVSTVCMSCTKCSKPNLGCDAAGGGDTVQACQSLCVNRIHLTQHPEAREESLTVYVELCS